MPLDDTDLFNHRQPFPREHLQDAASLAPVLAAHDADEITLLNMHEQRRKK